MHTSFLNLLMIRFALEFFRSIAVCRWSLSIVLMCLELVIEVLRDSTTLRFELLNYADSMSSIPSNLVFLIRPITFSSAAGKLKVLFSLPVYP